MSRVSPKSLPKFRVPSHPCAMRTSRTLSACCVAIAALSPSRIGSHAKMAFSLGDGNFLRIRPTTPCPDWQSVHVGERSATTRTFWLEELNSLRTSSAFSEDIGLAEVAASVAEIPDFAAEGWQQSCWAAGEAPIHPKLNSAATISTAG